jgi:hypothetical protein
MRGRVILIHKRDRDPSAMHDGCYSNSSANSGDRDAQIVAIVTLK